MRHDECPMAVTLREKREVRGSEAIAERPDGSRVTFLPYPVLLRNRRGEIVGALNMLLDVSDRAEQDEICHSDLLQSWNRRTMRS